jgi:hypothetical protein
MIKLCAILLMIEMLQAYATATDDIASPNQALRDASATELRRTYVPPSRQKWEFLLAEIKPGMSRADIGKVTTLHRIPSDGEMSRAGSGLCGIASTNAGDWNA